MTLVVGDRIQETTTTTGTGTITLLGAVTQFQSFAAGVGNGNSTYYTIADQSGVNWEEGIGTYTTSGSTLTRTVLASSNAGALVNFPAGTKNVFCSYPAEAAVLAAPYAYPTVSPTLNLDFANSKQLDPRVTFSRLSTATYYDGQTTAMAEQNLLLYSNTSSNTAWVATNGTVASGVTDPAGTTTAFSFTATGANATLYQTLTTTATPYTLSFYIQRVTGTGAVNLTLDGTTLTAQTITGSWARYSVTATPTAASHTIGLQLAVSGDVVNIFSSQLENRSSVTAANITTTSPITNYIPVLMTAPAGVARFDHDPISGKSLGLLIEESRTNLLSYSQDFSQSVWATANVGWVGDTVIAPDGTLTGGTRTALVTNSSGIRNLGAIGSTLGITYSLYIKKGNTSVVSFALRNHTSGLNILVINFNYDTGVVTINTSAISTLGATGVTATPVGNGWYRLVMPSATTSFANNDLVWVYNFSTGSVQAGEYNYVWGAQLEAGSFATSYIPTTAGSVSRSADLAIMSGTNFSDWYNQIEGSIYVEYAHIPATISGSSVISIRSASTDEFNFYGRSATGDGLYATTSGAGVSIGGMLIDPRPTAPTKVSYSWKPLSIQASVSGVLKFTDTTSIISKSFTKIGIGCNASTGGSVNGYIKKLAYYPKALSTTELQALTS